MSDTNSIRTYFSKLGLSSEIAEIYLALHVHGRQTISELSRHSGIERTRIYRLMDELRASGLVEVEKQYKRSIFTAAPIANLQILLSKKEQELHDLRTEFQSLQETFSTRSLSSPSTKVQAYQGSEGLKQMFWNQTRSSSGENLSILYENMQGRSNLAFFERWVAVFNAKGINARSIIGDNFLRTQQEWYGTHKNERLRHWQGRYIPEGVFPVTHSMVIYDDVTSYYNWKNGEILGIEIHNQEIADAQRHFFEMLWVQGLPIDNLKFKLKE